MEHSLIHWLSRAGNVIARVQPVARSMSASRARPTVFLWVTSVKPVRRMSLQMETIVLSVASSASTVSQVQTNVSDVTTTLSLSSVSASANKVHSLTCLRISAPSATRVARHVRTLRPVRHVQLDIHSAKSYAWSANQTNISEVMSATSVDLIVWSVRQTSAQFALRALNFSRMAHVLARAENTLILWLMHASNVIHRVKRVWDPISANHVPQVLCWEILSV